jgi:hypothetical protein
VFGRKHHQPGSDTEFQAFVSGTLRIIFGRCAHQIYSSSSSSIKPVGSAAAMGGGFGARPTYSLPQLLADALADARLALSLLPSLLGAVSSLAFERDAYLLRVLNKDLFGLLFERFCYCTCPRNAAACLGPADDAVAMLEQIHRRAATFAAALQGGGGGAAAAQMRRLREYVLCRLVPQYFSAVARAHPSYPCLLQITTQFVKLLNGHALEACQAAARVVGGGGGGGGGGNLSVPDGAERSEDVRRREVELMALLPAMITVLRNTPAGAVARGDIYSAISSTLATLADMWLLVGASGPTRPEWRQVLTAVAKVLAVEVMFDAFESALPTPNHPLRGRIQSLLPHGHERTAAAQRLGAATEAALRQQTDWAAGLPAAQGRFEMCDCMSPRREAPRRVRAGGAGAVVDMVARQALGALFHAGTLGLDASLAVGGALPRLHRLLTEWRLPVAGGSGVVRTPWYYKPFLERLGPGGAAYLCALRPPASALDFEITTALRCERPL